MGIYFTPETQLYVSLKVVNWDGDDQLVLLPQSASNSASWPV